MIVFSSCVERFEIPKIINSESSELFGAGDTTYLQLKPIWDETYGLEDPSEISIAPDGRIFVSDRWEILYMFLIRMAQERKVLNFLEI